MKVPKAKKLKSGTWFIQLRLGGESIPVSAQSETACIKEARAIKAEYLAGKRNQIEEVEKLPTVKEMIDSYIESKSNILSPSTIRGYRTIQKNRFSSLMDLSASDITNADWIEACNKEAASCSAKTLVNSWRFIATVLRQNGIDPPEITMPQVTPNERQFLDPDQIKIFVAAVKGKPVEIPALLALHSLRRSEICALTWDNIDFKKRQIFVKGATVQNEDNKFVKKSQNKNKSSVRYVPILMDELYDALVKQKDKSGFIVSCHPTTIWKQVNAVCKENNLPEVGIHGLRHSFASLAYHLGVPELVTMQIGGWQDNQTMRKIYTHISKTDINSYSDKLTDFFKPPSKNANENANKN